MIEKKYEEDKEEEEEHQQGEKETREGKWIVEGTLYYKMREKKYQ